MFISIVADQQENRGSRGILFSCLFIMLFVLLTSFSAKADYEEPPILQAKALLAPELLKSKYHSVNDKVKNNGLFNHYTVESDFGIFQADSTTNLEILIRELVAIAAMKEVEADDTAWLDCKSPGRKLSLV